MAHGKHAAIPVALVFAGLLLAGAEAQAQSSTASTRAVTTITGEGTGSASSGRIARFTGTNQIGDSVVQQSTAGNIGINAFPSAVLHVIKVRPATQAGNGANATVLLRTSGGKGGGTSGTGTTGGKGADISLLAGNGGDAVSGSTNGTGGSVTLQPGIAGNGGLGGTAGNVLLAPFGGNVGIGTTNPSRALQIGPGFDPMFTLEPSDGSPHAGFIRFGDSTGWQLRIGRSRESSGGPLNKGTTGTLVELRDNGAFRLGLFPLGNIGTQPLCRIIGVPLANFITPCGSSVAGLKYRTGAEPYRRGLDIIDRLQPIAFSRTDTGLPALGLAAEEVIATEPLLGWRNEKGEPEGVNYDLLGVLFVNAIKQQQVQLRQQQELIEQLQSRLERLEAAAAQRLSAK